MSRFPFLLLACGAAMLATARCGKPGPSAPGGKAATTAPPAAEAKPAPFTYPAPVQGGIHEINTGRFPLVDGVAYAAGDGSGTVVFASSRPLASPVLADSPCPMTEARSLAALRDSDWAEVTIDAKGRSKYFGYGKTFGGSGFDKSPGGRYWTIRLKESPPGRIAGEVRHREYGQFEFDLPVARPQGREVSEMDRSDGRRSDETLSKPGEAAVTAAYRSVREAALAKNLKGVLSAQGFAAGAIEKIRGLEGIDADLAVYADRFLDPGVPTPGEFTAQPGTAYVRADGVNSKGKKFANFYHFNPCGSRLVLVSISENPQ